MKHIIKAQRAWKTAGGSGGGPSQDKLVKVSNNDTVANYLSNKLVSTDMSATFTILNAGANEQYDISVTGGGGGGGYFLITVAALQALQGANAMVQGAYYQITDVTPDWQVVLLAESGNTIATQGQGIYQNALYTEAWYDLGINSLEKIYDPLYNNTVEGQINISTFPWNNSVYYNNYLDKSSAIVAYPTTVFNFNDNYITQNSSIDFTDAAINAFRFNTITNQSVIDLTSTTISVFSNNLFNCTNLFADAATVNQFYQNQFFDTTLSIDGGYVGSTFDYCFFKASGITFTSAQINEFSRNTMYDTAFYGNSMASNQFFTDNSFDGGTYNFISSNIGQFYSNTLSGYDTGINYVGGITTYFSDNVINNSGLQGSGCNNANVANNVILVQSGISFDNTTFDVFWNNLEGNSYIYATSATINNGLLYNKISQSSYIDVNSATLSSLEYNVVIQNSYINMPNVTGGTYFEQNNLSNNSYVEADTANLTDFIGENTLNDYSYIYVAANSNVYDLYANNLEIESAIYISNNVGYVNNYSYNKLSASYHNLNSVIIQDFYNNQLLNSVITDSCSNPATPTSREYYGNFLNSSNIYNYGGNNNCSRNVLNCGTINIDFSSQPSNILGNIIESQSYITLGFNAVPYVVNGIYENKLTGSSYIQINDSLDSCNLNNLHGGSNVVFTGSQPNTAFDNNQVTTNATLQIGNSNNCYLNRNTFVNSDFVFTGNSPNTLTQANFLFNTISNNVLTCTIIDTIFDNFRWNGFTDAREVDIEACTFTDVLRNGIQSGGRLQMFTATITELFSENNINSGSVLYFDTNSVVNNEVSKNTLSNNSYLNVNSNSSTNYISSNNLTIQGTLFINGNNGNHSYNSISYSSCNIGNTFYFQGNTVITDCSINTTGCTQITSVQDNFVSGNSSVNLCNSSIGSLNSFDQNIVSSQSYVNGYSIDCVGGSIYGNKLENQGYLDVLNGAVFQNIAFNTFSNQGELYVETCNVNFITYNIIQHNYSDLYGGVTINDFSYNTLSNGAVINASGSATIITSIYANNMDTNGSLYVNSGQIYQILFNNITSNSTLNINGDIHVINSNTITGGSNINLNGNDANLSEFNYNTVESNANLNISTSKAVFTQNDFRGRTMTTPTPTQYIFENIQPVNETYATILANAVKNVDSFTIQNLNTDFFTNNVFESTFYLNIVDSTVTNYLKNKFITYGSNDIFNSNLSLFTGNIGDEGAIQIYDSTISNVFANNYAGSGGTIQLNQSTSANWTYNSCTGNTYLRANTNSVAQNVSGNSVGNGSNLEIYQTNGSIAFNQVNAGSYLEVNNVSYTYGNTISGESYFYTYGALSISSIQDNFLNGYAVVNLCNQNGQCGNFSQNTLTSYAAFGFDYLNNPSAQIYQNTFDSNSFVNFQSTGSIDTFTNNTASNTSLYSIGGYISITNGNNLSGNAGIYTNNGTTLYECRYNNITSGGYFEVLNGTVQTCSNNTINSNSWITMNPPTGVDYVNNNNLDTQSAFVINSNGSNIEYNNLSNQSSCILTTNDATFSFRDNTFDNQAHAEVRNSTADFIQNEFAGQTIQGGMTDTLYLFDTLVPIDEVITTVKANTFRYTDALNFINIEVDFFTNNHFEGAYLVDVEDSTIQNFTYNGINSKGSLTLLNTTCPNFSNNIVESQAKIRFDTTLNVTGFFEGNYVFGAYGEIVQNSTIVNIADGIYKNYVTNSGLWIGGDNTYIGVNTLMSQAYLGVYNCFQCAVNFLSDFGDLESDFCTSVGNMVGNCITSGGYVYFSNYNNIGPATIQDFNYNVVESYARIAAPNIVSPIASIQYNHLSNYANWTFDETVTVATMWYNTTTDNSYISIGSNASLSNLNLNNLSSASQIDLQNGSFNNVNQNELSAGSLLLRDSVDNTSYNRIDSNSTIETTIGSSTDTINSNTLSAGSYITINDTVTQLSSNALTSGVQLLFMNNTYLQFNYNTLESRAWVDIEGCNAVFIGNDFRGTTSGFNNPYFFYNIVPLAEAYALLDQNVFRNIAYFNIDTLTTDFFQSNRIDGFSDFEIYNSTIGVYRGNVVESGAYFYVNSATVNSCQYNTVNTLSEVDLATGTIGNFDDNFVSNSSYIDCEGTTGLVKDNIVTACSSAYIYNVLNFYRNSITAGSNFSSNNTSNIQEVSFNTLESQSTLSAYGATLFRLQANTVSNYGQMTLNALINSSGDISRNIVRANSTLTLTGTSTFTNLDENIVEANSLFTDMGFGGVNVTNIRGNRCLSYAGIRIYTITGSQFLGNMVTSGDLWAKQLTMIQVNSNYVNRSSQYYGDGATINQIRSNYTVGPNSGNNGNLSVSGPVTMYTFEGNNVRNAGRLELTYTTAHNFGACDWNCIDNLSAVEFNDVTVGRFGGAVFGDKGGNVVDNGSVLTFTNGTLTICTDNQFNRATFIWNNSISDAIRYNVFANDSNIDLTNSTVNNFLANHVVEDGGLSFTNTTLNYFNYNTFDAGYFTASGGNYSVQDNRVEKDSYIQVSDGSGSFSYNVLEQNSSIVLTNSDTFNTISYNTLIQNSSLYSSGTNTLHDIVYNDLRHGNLSLAAVTMQSYASIDNNTIIEGTMGLGSSDFQFGLTSNFIKIAYFSVTSCSDASAVSWNWVYDGNFSVNAVTFGVNGPYIGDNVVSSGTFAIANVSFANGNQGVWGNLVESYGCCFINQNGNSSLSLDEFTFNTINGALLDILSGTLPLFRMNWIKGNRYDTLQGFVRFDNTFEVADFSYNQIFHNGLTITSASLDTFNNNIFSNCVFTIPSNVAINSCTIKNITGGYTLSASQDKATCDGTAFSTFKYRLDFSNVAVYNAVTTTLYLTNEQRDMGGIFFADNCAAGANIVDTINNFTSGGQIIRFFNGTGTGYPRFDGASGTIKLKSGSGANVSLNNTGNFIDLFNQLGSGSPQYEYNHANY